MFFFSSRRRHTRCLSDWSSDVCSSDLKGETYTIEVLSDRLGSQTDMYFLLRKEDTKQELANLDDNPEVLNALKLYTHSEEIGRASCRERGTVGEGGVAGDKREG